MDKQQELELLLLEQELRNRKADATPKEPISASKAALRGAIQQATYGTSDEIGGGLDVAMDYGNRALNAVGLADKSPGQVNDELKQAGFKGNIGPSSAKEIYTGGRNDERAQDAAAETAQPGAFKVGQLAGAIAAPSPLPGAGLIAKGAAEGGLLTAGMSQGKDPSQIEDVSDIASDAVKGGVVGGATGAAVKSGGKLMDYLSNKFKTSMPANIIAEAAKNNAGLVGGAVGMATHGPAGAVTGYLAGEAVVPKVIKKLGPSIDKFDESFQNLMSTLPTKYKTVMEDAGRRGVQSQAVQHFLMSQRDPEYQQLAKDSQEISSK